MSSYTVSWRVQARVDAPSCRDAAIAALKKYRHSPQSIPSVCVLDKTGEKHDVVLSGFPYFLLTERETEVLSLLLLGYDNNSIGAELHLTERTVKDRLSKLMHKVGVHNRVQLAVAAATLDAGQPAQRDMSRYRAALDALGPKRKHIAALVREGLTNRAIAQVLGTTEGTIKGYLKSIYDALGVSTRLELANWMLSLGPLTRLGETMPPPAA
jgi:DNA-binding NarL/FixJ family response regulator